MLNCVTVRQARRVLLGLIESSSVAVRLGESWQARSVALSYTRVWQCKLRYGKAGMVSCGRLGLGLFGSGRHGGDW